MNKHVPLQTFTEVGRFGFPDMMGIGDFLDKMQSMDRSKLFYDSLIENINLAKKESTEQFLKYANLPLTKKQKKLFSGLHELCLRSFDLLILGLEEDIKINKNSVNEFFDTCRYISDHSKNHLYNRPALFLQDNGNFSIMWAKGEEQAAFEFKGDNKMQYVIFANRNGYIARSSGDDDLDKIIPLLKLNGLNKLVFE